MPKEKFEDNLKRLEVIVETLEGGQTELDEAIKLLEEGLTIGKKLNKQLTSFEEKINELTNEEQENE